MHDNKQTTDKHNQRRTNTNNRIKSNEPRNHERANKHNKEKLAIEQNQRNTKRTSNTLPERRNKRTQQITNKRQHNTQTRKHKLYLSVYRGGIERARETETDETHNDTEINIYIYI